MGDIISEMVTFVVVNVDMVEAIGMDDSEFMILWWGFEQDFQEDAPAECGRPMSASG